jgi:glycerol-3-phosphate O-acyltransferase
MLGLRRMVTRTDGGLVVNPDERVLLAYYANSIAHLFES